MDWGKQLRTFRERANLKQEAAARLLGVSQASVSRLESGLSQPSDELRERLAQLLARPEHRPVLAYYKAIVDCSPHYQFLIGVRNGQATLEARSPSMNTLGEPFSRRRVGDVIDEDLGENAVERLAELTELGVFAGEIASVETTWTYRHADGREDIWRAQLVPIRDEHNRWFVFGTLTRSDAATRSRLEAKWAGPFAVRPHDKPDASATSH